MAARLRRWLGPLLGLALTAWLVLPNAVTPTMAASLPAGARRLVLIDVALAIDNMYGFSSRDKTYGVEGILRGSAPAAELQRWLSAGLDPVTRVRFQNQVQPWDALLEPISGMIGERANLRRDYRFHGTSYPDEIDFRSYSFRVLPLRLNLVPHPSSPQAISSPPAIRLVAQSQGSGAGLPESRDLMPLRQAIGPCGMGERLLPPYGWMGGHHCQNSQTGTFRQPCPGVPGTEGFGLDHPHLSFLEPLRSLGSGQFSSRLGRAPGPDSYPMGS